MAKNATHNYQKNKTIFLVVPGFIGNYKEGFIKNIFNFLKRSGYDVRKISFRGHDNRVNELANLEEMVLQLTQEFLLIRKRNRQKNIVVLAHSQGCAVSLKASSAFADKKTSFILFSPVIFLQKIILSRISDNEIEKISAGKPRKCKISRTKRKIIDPVWVESYKNFSLQKELSRIKQPCLIIRPKDDYIPLENVRILRKKLPNNEYVEVEGDHTFEEPPGAFLKLMKKIFIDKFRRQYLGKLEH